MSETEIENLNKSISEWDENWDRNQDDLLPKVIKKFSKF